MRLVNGVGIVLHDQVRRSHLLEDAMNQLLRNKNPKELRKPLRAEFVGAENTAALLLGSLRLLRSLSTFWSRWGQVRSLTRVCCWDRQQVRTG